MYQRAGLYLSRIAAVCLILSSGFLWAQTYEAQAVVPLLLFGPFFFWLYAAPLIHPTSRERLLTIFTLVGLATLLWLNHAGLSVFTLWDGGPIRSDSRPPTIAMLFALITIMGATLSQNRIALSIATALVPGVAAWKFATVLGEPSRGHVGLGIAYDINALCTLGFCIAISLAAGSFFLLLVTQKTFGRALPPRALELDSAARDGRPSTAQRGNAPPEAPKDWHA